MPSRKVLLDECVDWRLGKELSGHDVQSVAKIGWSGLKNGNLLTKAQVDFDVFITTDRNLMFQQNLPKFDIAVIVLSAKSDRLQDLLQFVPQIMDAIPSAMPGVPIVLKS